MTKTADQIIEELMSTPWKPALVSIRYFDSERRKYGNTASFSYELALAKLEAMKRHNPKWICWLEEPDDDGDKEIR